VNATKSSDQNMRKIKMQALGNETQAQTFVAPFLSDSFKFDSVIQESNECNRK